jgi:hypothetical protein
MLHKASKLEAPFKVDRLAALIGYHPQSLRRVIRQGRIATIPFGKGYRIPAQEVRRILAKGLPCRRQAHDTQ